MITSELVDKIFPALVKAQSVIKNAPKNSENPFFKSRYADLATIIDVAKEPTANNGLAVLQSPSTEDGKVKITTRIIHESGQWVEDSISFTLQKTDPQSVGSAITYGRRYSLAAMLGIAQEDDDGNAGSDPSKTQAQPKKETPPPAPKTKGSIAKALDGLKAAKDPQAVNSLKKIFSNMIWNEQEELQLDDAFKNKMQSFKN
jgi:hypothetical protein